MPRFLPPVLPALALCAAWPAPGLAGLTICPGTPEESVRGIAVTYDDGSRSVTVLTPETGDTVEVFTYPDGYVLRSELMLALNTTKAVDTDASGAELPDTTFLYSYTPARPETLAPGLQWQADYTMTGPNGQVSGRYTMNVGAETQVAIGGCSYRSWPVTMLSRDPEYSFMVQADYLPELRIAIIRGYGELLGAKLALIPLTIGLDG